MKRNASLPIANTKTLPATLIALLALLGCTSGSIERDNGNAPSSTSNVSTTPQSPVETETDDASSWTFHPITELSFDSDDFVALDIAAVNDRFVAIGSGNPSRGDVTSWYSTDGLNWITGHLDLVTNPDPGIAVLDRIHPEKDQLYVQTASGAATTLDGASWHLTRFPEHFFDYCRFEALWPTKAGEITAVDACSRPFFTCVKPHPLTIDVIEADGHAISSTEHNVDGVMAAGFSQRTAVVLAYRSALWDDDTYVEPDVAPEDLDADCWSNVESTVGYMTTTDGGVTWTPIAPIPTPIGAIAGSGFSPAGVGAVGVTIDDVVVFTGYSAQLDGSAGLVIAELRIDSLEFTVTPWSWSRRMPR